MAQRGQAHARRRRVAADYAIDWTRAPSTWEASRVDAEFDAVRYDDVLRPALRVRATLRLDENGEPAELINLAADRRLT